MRIRTPARLFTPRVIHCPAAFLDLPALSPTFNDDIPFPSIPTIRSDDIRTRVFTHRSFYARPNHVFEDHSDDPSPDNEIYELLGDTVLGLVATSLLLNMYPNLRVGSYTKMRSLIVCNRTLAAISCRYALPVQLRFHPSQGTSVRTSLNKQADVFESYVGGLYLDRGLTTVEEWLKALFKPYAIEAYTHVRTQHGLPPLSPSVSPQLTPSTVSLSSIDATSLTGHLALFNEKLQKEKREVKFYDDCVTEGTATTPIWAARVEVDGKVFGHGKGSTKKAARNEAAKEGLVHMGIIV